MNLITVSVYIIYALVKTESVKMSTHSNVETTNGADVSLNSLPANSTCNAGDTFVKAGLCLDQGYNDAEPPNATETKVVYDYMSLEILAIKEEDNKIELFFELTYSWEDDRITLISSFIKPLDDIGAPINGIFVLGDFANQLLNATIWYPKGIRMENVTNAELTDGQRAYLIFTTGKSFKAQFPTAVLPNTDPNNTLVTAGEYWKITMPCHFDPTAFPFDTHSCKFKQSNELARRLIPIIEPFDAPKNISKFGFTITGLAEEGIDEKHHRYVGLTFKMKRIYSPFVFQYYLPAAAIVIVSQISFVIPSHSIPGRMGLLATLFLTLINLFINHMVILIK